MEWVDFTESALGTDEDLANPPGKPNLNGVEGRANTMTVFINGLLCEHQTLDLSSPQCCPASSAWAKLGFGWQMNMVISLVFFVHCLVRMLLDKLLELLDVSKNGIRPFLLSVIALWHQFPVLNSLLYMNIPYLNSFPQIPILKQKRGEKTYPKLYLANTSPGNYPKLWIPTKDVNIYLLFMCI